MVVVLLESPRPTSEFDPDTGGLSRFSLGLILTGLIFACE